MNRFSYQFRTETTQHLADARCGKTLVRTMPNIISQLATDVVDNAKDEKNIESQSFDLAYFKMIACEQEARNLAYVSEKINMYYSNRKR